MPTVEIEGTRLAWHSVGEWCALAMREGAVLRPATSHYRRLDALYRSLTVACIRASHDTAGIARAAWMFDRARHHELPCGRGLGRTFSRSELGAMLVEVAAATMHWSPGAGCCRARKGHASTRPGSPTRRLSG